MGSPALRRVWFQPQLQPHAVMARWPNNKARTRLTAEVAAMLNASSPAALHKRVMLFCQTACASSNLRRARFYNNTWRDNLCITKFRAFTSCRFGKMLWQVGHGNPCHICPTCAATIVMVVQSAKKPVLHECVQSVGPTYSSPGMLVAGTEPRSWQRGSVQNPRSYATWWLRMRLNNLLGCRRLSCVPVFPFVHCWMCMLAVAAQQPFARSLLELPEMPGKRRFGTFSQTRMVGLQPLVLAMLTTALATAGGQQLGVNNSPITHE